MNRKPSILTAMSYRSESGAEYNLFAFSFSGEVWPIFETLSSGSLPRLFISMFSGKCRFWSISVMRFNSIRGF